jgi:hypothetical protein
MLLFWFDKRGQALARATGISWAKAQDGERLYHHAKAWCFRQEKPHICQRQVNMGHPTIRDSMLLFWFDTRGVCAGGPDGKIPG